MKTADCYISDEVLKKYVEKKDDYEVPFVKQSNIHE